MKPKVNTGMTSISQQKHTKAANSIQSATSEEKLSSAQLLLTVKAISPVSSYDSK